jgi:hypothetical protein
MYLGSGGTQWGTSYSERPLYGAKSETWTRPVIPTLSVWLKHLPGHRRRRDVARNISAAHLWRRNVDGHSDRRQSSATPIERSSRRG